MEPSRVPRSSSCGAESRPNEEELRKSASRILIDVPYFAWRPLLGYARYRLPLEALYLCGSGAHPGGGVTGVPGRNAAREILADRLHRERPEA